jgi:hypothetical protein
MPPRLEPVCVCSGCNFCFGLPCSHSQAIARYCVGCEKATSELAQRAVELALASAPPPPQLTKEEQENEDIAFDDLINKIKAAQYDSDDDSWEFLRD